MCGVFRDLEKVFDTVNHEIIAIKLLKLEVNRMIGFDPFLATGNNTCR